MYSHIDNVSVDDLRRIFKRTDDEKEMKTNSTKQTN